MIESLTQEQINKLPLYKEKWNKIALSTEPCDVEQSKYWITKAYEQVGLTLPTEWKVFGSPLSYTRRHTNIVFTLPGVINLDLLQIRNQTYNRVWDQVRGQVRTQVWEQVRQHVWGRVRAQVWNHILAQVWKQAGGRIDTSYGNHESRLMQYDFYLNELKLDCVKPAIPLIELAKYCGWWMPHEKTCLLTHKPIKINLNAEDILHNESGPSILYRDGFSIWSLNGVIVDEQLVLHPETQTIEQINEELYEDVRSLRIERFGWDRYLKESGATIIESGPNDIDTTHEILARTPVGLRLLTLCPSTGRVYSLGIGDVGVSTCLGAQQWLWGNKSFRFVGRT